MTGIAAQFVLAVAVILGLGRHYGPVTAFTLLATVIVTVIIGVYIVVDLACAGYFLRRRRDLFSPLRHVVFPAARHRRVRAGAAHRGGDPGVLVRRRTHPAGVVRGSRRRGMDGGGVVVLAVLARRLPERLAETGRVHLVEPDEAPEETGAVRG